MLSSRNEELATAAEQWQEIRAENKPTQQKQLQAIVDKVGRAIASQADSSMRISWSFHLFSGLDANAFCLPDGKVCLYDGLFLHVRNEAELAAVIGHEIAHVVARHGSERLSQEHIVNQGRLLLTTALGYADCDYADEWLAAYTGLANVGILYPYSRQHEYIADRMAMLFMSRAGYNPQAAMDFWSRFANSHSTPDGIAQFMSTHPTDAKRVENLRLVYPEALSIYKVSPRYGFGAKFSIAK